MGCDDYKNGEAFWFGCLGRGRAAHCGDSGGKAGSGVSVSGRQRKVVRSTSNMVTLRPPLQVCVQTAGWMCL